MEISVLKRTGAGENEEGRVGSASILYMETLMETAIRETFPDLELEYDADFNRAVDQLEMQLQECTSMIKGVFDEYGTEEQDLDEDTMDEEDYLFTEIMYKGSCVEIPYQLMVRVYNEKIRGVFEEKMDEVIAYMDAHEIAYMDRNDERFKIVLVGGFCNYYLVKQQVAEKFAFSSMDMRQKHVIRSQEECEKAISLGSALLASGVIRIRNTAPYSIGIRVKKGKGNSLTYGLYQNQDIEFNRVYFQRERDSAEKDSKEKDSKGKYVVILSVSGGIEGFIIDTYGDKRVAFGVYPKPEFRERLSKAIMSKNGTVVVGFSLDSSGVLSLHIHEYDIFEDKISEEGRKIELTSFRELFDTHEVERVYEYE